MHVDPPPSSLVKGKNDEKLDRYCVRTKLRRDPKSQESDLYELKMALIDNGKPE